MPMGGMFLTVAGDAPWVMVMTDKDERVLYSDKQEIRMLIYRPVKNLARRLQQRIDAK